MCDLWHVSVIGRHCFIGQSILLIYLQSDSTFNRKNKFSKSFKKGHVIFLTVHSLSSTEKYLRIMAFFSLTVCHAVIGCKIVSNGGEGGEGGSGPLLDPPYISYRQEHNVYSTTASLHVHTVVVPLNNYRLSRKMNHIVHTQMHKNAIAVCRRYLLTSVYMYRLHSRSFQNKRNQLCTWPLHLFVLGASYWSIL